MRYFDQIQSPALLRRMESLAGLPRSRAFYTLRQRVAGSIVRGNRAGLLAGTDGRGRPLVPVKARRGKYRGATGPPLAPFRERSRVITNFRADWKSEGSRWVLLMGWHDIVSEKGVPFLIYHLTGGRRLPKRNIAGIRPRTWAELREHYARLVPDLLKGPVP